MDEIEIIVSERNGDKAEESGVDGVPVREVREDMIEEDVLKEDNGIDKDVVKANVKGTEIKVQIN